MKDAATLLALAERVEALAGPDRDVDARVRYAIDAREYPGGEAFTLVEATDDHPAFEHVTRAGLLQQVARDGSARFTASLDAAMTLVPEGHTIQLSDWDAAVLREKGAWQAIVLPMGARGAMSQFTFSNRCDHAATPALALTAAALRAHAAIAGEGE